MRQMAAGQSRLVSIDFWRGFALLTIFINHVPGHFLSDYTFRNFGMSDAAELFVLLAGISAAFAYLRPMMGGESARPLARVLLRAFQLYTAHLALVIVAVMVIGGFVVLTQDTRILELYHLDIITRWPVESFVGLGLLTFQPAYLNILPLYVSLLVAAPVILLLARVHPFLALAASAGLYLATQLAGLALPVWPGDGGWYFNPFAWQLLFTTGAAASVIVRRMETSPHVLVLIAAAAYVLFAFIVAAPWVHYSWLPDGRLLSQELVEPMSKHDLSAWRLLHVLALAYLVAAIVPAHASWLRQRWAQVVQTCGKHSLEIFSLGTLLSFFGWIALTEFGSNQLAVLAVNVIGIAIMSVTAWQMSRRRQFRALPQPSRSQAHALAS